MYYTLSSAKPMRSSVVWGMNLDLRPGMRDSVQQDGTALVFVLFQKLFGIHGRHATGARSRDRLAIAMVLHVAGNEHSWNRGEAAVLGEQVAVRIHLEFALVDGGVRIVTDGHEYPVERNFARLL